MPMSIPLRDKTTPAVRHARERKIRNHKTRQQALQEEAARKGVTVQEVLFAKHREVADILNKAEAQRIEAARAAERAYRERPRYYGW